MCLDGHFDFALFKISIFLDLVPLQISRLPMEMAMVDLGIFLL